MAQRAITAAGDVAMDAQTARLTLVATGDWLPTRPVAARSEVGFVQVLDTIAAADCALTNLECPVFDGRGYPAAESGGLWPYAGTWVGSDLAACGFDLVGLANNHIMDFMAGGLTATCESLAQAGLTWAGAGPDLAAARRPAYLESRSGRVAMIAVTSTRPSHAAAGAARDGLPGRPGANVLEWNASRSLPPSLAGEVATLAGAYGHGRGPQPWRGQWTEAVPVWFGGQRFHVGSALEVRSWPDEDTLKANLAQVREASRQAEWVVVQVHSHEVELDPDVPASFLRTFCRGCIDAGAHVVIGHGPHRTRGIEIYRGWPILYSLGNFLVQNETTPALPDDAYQMFGLGPNATPADVFDHRWRRDGGHPAGALGRSSVLPSISLAVTGLAGLTLWPVALGADRARPERGLPQLAQEPEAVQILGRVQRLSAALGTRLAREGPVLRWRSGPPDGVSEPQD